MHKKTPVLESLFHKVTGLLKRDSCFPVNVANFFKNNYFEEHLRMATSESQFFWNRFMIRQAVLFWRLMKTLTILAGTQMFKIKGKTSFSS